MTISDRVRDALVETALVEELAHTDLPDVWPELAARMQAPRARRPSVGWMVAAGLLLGLGVLVGIQLLVRAGDEAPVPAQDPEEKNSVWVDPSVDADGPTSLEDLQGWFDEGASLRRARVQVWTVTSDLLGRAVAVRPADLFRLFGVDPDLDLEVAQRDALRRAVLGAEVVPVRLEGRPWEAVVEMDVGRRKARVAISGCGRWPEADPLSDWKFALCTTEGAIGLSMDREVWRDLRPSLGPLVADTLRHRHVVIGDAELARMDDDASWLTLHGVTAAAVERLGRFQALRSLDIRSSPALHGAAALRALQPLGLESLQADGAFLQADGVAAVASLTSLTELFLWPAGMMEAVMGGRALPSPPRAPALDDDGMRELAALTHLEELGFAGATMTDAGVRALARLPELESLMLFDAGSVSGTGFDGWEHPLSRLVMMGAPLTAQGMEAIARLSSLERLTVELAARPSLAMLERLASSPLATLHWSGPLDADGLERLAHLPALRRLSLLHNTELRADHLLPLRAVPELESVTIHACPDVDRAELAAIEARFDGVTLRIEPQR